MRYYFVFIISFLSIENSIANCTEETKSFDDCLQCCTDTALVQTTLKEAPSIGQVIVDGCQADQRTGVASGSYKGIYEKFKVDYTTYRILCENKTFLNTAKYEALPYEKCPDVCEKKFKEKK